MGRQKREAESLTAPIKRLKEALPDISIDSINKSDKTLRKGALSSLRSTLQSTNKVAFEAYDKLRKDSEKYAWLAAFMLDPQKRGDAGAEHHVSQPHQRHE